jgi:hypothetical protein
MSTARKPAKVYVGNYYKSPVKLIQPPEYVHPKDFGKVYKNLGRDCFSNNPVFVDEAELENVMVVGDDGSIRPLSSHHRCEEWRGEFRAGEIWSFTDDGNWTSPTVKLHSA